MRGYDKKPKIRERLPYQARVYYLPKYDVYLLRPRSVGVPRIEHELVGELTVDPEAMRGKAPYPVIDQARDWLEERGA